MIDVNSINFSENILLTNITQVFTWLGSYAKHLLYYFISFELIVAGLSWALYQTHIAERFFFQVMKIAFILFVIGHYDFILNSILASNLLMGKHFIQPMDQSVLFNPGFVWQYGYHAGVQLLQAAVTVDGFGMPLLLIILGMGIIFVFGIFGIQVCLRVLRFYSVATLSLLVLPFSTFSPLKDFFSRAMQSVLQSSFALLMQMLLVSAGVNVWASFANDKINHLDFNTALGLLFSGLLFVMTSAYLPRKVESLIAGIHWQNSEASMSSSIQASINASSSSSSSIAAYASANNAIPTFSPSMSMQSPSNMEKVHVNIVRAQIEREGWSLSNIQRKEIEQQRLAEIQEIKTAFFEAFHDQHQDAAD